MKKIIALLMGLQLVASSFAFAAPVQAEDSEQIVNADHNRKLLSVDHEWGWGAWVAGTGIGLAGAALLQGATSLTSWSGDMTGKHYNVNAFNLVAGVIMVFVGGLNAE